MGIVSYAEGKKAARVHRAARIEPLLAEIVDALTRLGGAAHCDDIVDLIGRRRYGAACPAANGFGTEVFETFEAYVAMAGLRRPPPLIHRPFGPTSRRWALMQAGADLFPGREPLFVQRIAAEEK
jgi:hypothetical protein